MSGPSAKLADVTKVKTKTLAATARHSLLIPLDYAAGEERAGRNN
jgi:hypothetical protein